MALELFKADELKILNKSRFWLFVIGFSKNQQFYTYLNFSLFFNYLDGVGAYN